MLRKFIFVFFFSGTLFCMDSMDPMVLHQWCANNNQQSIKKFTMMQNDKFSVRFYHNYMPVPPEIIKEIIKFAIGQSTDEKSLAKKLSQWMQVCKFFYAAINGDREIVECVHNKFESLKALYFKIKRQQYPNLPPFNYEPFSLQISLKALENQNFVKRIKQFHENKSKLFADEPSMHFDIDIIWLIICFGNDIIDISKYYKNPLIYAIRQSEDEIAKFLIMKNLYLHELDEDWRSALEWCAHCAKKELAELLLKKGVYIVDALLNAAQRGDLETVQLLVKHGANINESNLCEYTPLMAAAKHGHKHIVEFLLKNEVNINAQDWDGNTALDYAKTDEIEQLLKEYASKQKIVPQCKVYNGCPIS